MTRTLLSRSKVKVTRPLCSPPCWLVRQLQRWAWERVGRGKLLLRCRLLGGARRFGAHGEERVVGISWRPPTYTLLVLLYKMTHFTVMLLSLLVQWQKGRIRQLILLNPIPMTVYNYAPDSTFRNCQLRIFIKCTYVPAVVEEIFAKMGGEEAKFCPCVFSSPLPISFCSRATSTYYRVARDTQYVLVGLLKMRLWSVVYG